MKLVAQTLQVPLLEQVKQLETLQKKQAPLLTVYPSRHWVHWSGSPQIMQKEGTQLTH